MMAAQQERRTSSVACLRTVKGTKPGETYMLKEGENTIGRRSDNTVVIKNKFVSGMHAIVEVKRGADGLRAWIQDRNTSNGTFIGASRKDAKKLSQEQSDELFHGQNIIIADNLFEFLFVDEKEAGGQGVAQAAPPPTQPVARKTENDDNEIRKVLSSGTAELESMKIMGEEEQDSVSNGTTQGLDSKSSRKRKGDDHAPQGTAATDEEKGAVSKRQKLDASKPGKREKAASNAIVDGGDEKRPAHPLASSTRWIVVEEKVTERDERDDEEQDDELNQHIGRARLFNAFGRRYNRYRHYGRKQVEREPLDTKYTSVFQQQHRLQKWQRLLKVDTEPLANSVQDLFYSTSKLWDAGVGAIIFEYIGPEEWTFLDQNTVSLDINRLELLLRHYQGTPIFDGGDEKGGEGGYGDECTRYLMDTIRRRCRMFPTSLQELRKYKRPVPPRFALSTPITTRSSDGAGKSSRLSQQPPSSLIPSSSSSSSSSSSPSSFSRRDSSSMMPSPSPPKPLLSRSLSFLPKLLKRSRSDGWQSHGVTIALEGRLRRCLKTPLHHYQKRTVLWARALESEVESGVTYSPPRSVYKIDNFEKTSDVGLHWERKQLVLASTLARPVLSFSGGIIANEMGLGKTLTAIALIYSTLARHQGAGGGDGAMAAGGNGDDGPPKMVGVQGRIRTAATLVACPSHLARQWKGEVDKHVNTAAITPKVIVITTSAEHRAVTLGDILEADIVVISVSLMQNPSYNKLLGKRAARSAAQREAALDNKAAIYLRKGDFAVKAPVLGAFMYERLVVDEGHELFSAKQASASTSIVDNLMCVRSRFRWYLSGTPFVDLLLTPRGALRLIDLKVNGENLIELESHGDKELLRWARAQKKSPDEFPDSILHTKLGACIDRLLYSRLFCRYTVKCVKGAYEVPDYEAEVARLKMHPLERCLYEVENDLTHGLDAKALRLMCTHPALSRFREQNHSSSQKNVKGASLLPLSLESAFEERLKGINSQIATIAREVRTIKAGQLELREQELPARLENQRARRLQRMECQKVKKMVRLERLLPIMNKMHGVFAAYGPKSFRERYYRLQRFQRAKDRAGRALGLATPLSCAVFIDVYSGIRGDRNVEDLEQAYTGMRREGKAHALAERSAEDVSFVMGYDLDVLSRFWQSYYSDVRADYVLGRYVTGRYLSRGRGLWWSGSSDPLRDYQFLEEARDTDGASDRSMDYVPDSSLTVGDVKRSHPKELKMLADMGFPEDHCFRALVAADYDLHQAIDWATEHKAGDDAGCGEGEEKAQEIRRDESVLKWGSKISYVLRRLRVIFEDPNSRIILFSNFNSFMSILRAVFQEEHIEFVLCTGNVMMRNKAISAFNNDEKVKVIMLSLESAASGANLQQATHVILMEPPPGSKEEADAIESQAIGRAHRQGQKKKLTVIRMAMEGTIEEDLLQRKDETSNWRSS